MMEQQIEKFIKSECEILSLHYINFKCINPQVRLPSIPTSALQPLQQPDRSVVPFQPTLIYKAANYYE